jgi:predicted nucleotide-binding protein
MNKPLPGNSVFVVHGRDETAKEVVSRFIQQLGLQPIILLEQVSNGRVIIEKLEHYSNVAFAVVLLTPDDIGGLAETKNDLLPRARQNVIFELGYFVGKLGRQKVCALYAPGVEIPSDFHGVTYVTMDKGEGWKLQLAKEIRGTGIDIDLNKVLVT